MTEIIFGVEKGVGCRRKIPKIVLLEGRGHKAKGMLVLTHVNFQKSEPTNTALFPQVPKSQIN